VQLVHNERLEQRTHEVRLIDQPFDGDSSDSSTT